MRMALGTPLCSVKTDSQTIIVALMRVSLGTTANL